MRRLFLLAALLAADCAGKKGESKSAADEQKGEIDDVHQEKHGDEIVTEYDLNRDKKPDVWKFSKKGADGKEITIRKEKDLNGDGKVDAWEFYDDAGQVTKIVYDMDFDGRADVTLIFEKGQLVRKEYDLDFDRKTDTWNFYEKGK